MKNKVNNIMSWNKGNLGALCSLQAGGTPSRNNLDYWKNGKIKWISAKHITDDKIQGWEYISEDGLKNSSSKLSNPGDLILVTRVSVGKLLFCDDSYAVNQDLTIIKPISVINNKFLFYNLKSLLGKIISSSQGLAIKGIERKTLEKLPILYPNIKEQQKIVEVLETWDKAIVLTKQLIEQKELQKKYLMQQLLTGRTRLKGFTSKWKTEKLNELIRVYQGYPFKSETYTENGRYNVVTIANVQQGYLELNACSKIANIPSDLRSFQKLEIGDIILSMTGNVGRSCYVSIPNCLLNQRVAKIQGIHLNSQFLYYSLQNPRFIYTMIAFAQGGAQANLSVKDIKNYALYFPTEEPEQQQIARIISFADKEIDLLKQKLIKLEEQKKGLMQVLLTGKIKLKI